MDSPPTTTPKHLNKFVIGIIAVTGVSCVGVGMLLHRYLTGHSGGPDEGNVQTESPCDTQKEGMEQSEAENAASPPSPNRSGASSQTRGPTQPTDALPEPERSSQKTTISGGTFLQSTIGSAGPITYNNRNARITVGGKKEDEERNSSNR